MKKYSKNTNLIKSNLQNLIFIVFLSGLVLTFFVYWPWAKIPFEIPKVYFFQRWIEIATIAAIVAIRKNKISEKGDLLLTSLIVLYLLWAVCSSYLGANLGKSFVGNYYRGDGLITLLHLVILYLLAAIILNRKRVYLVLKAIAVSSATLGTLGLIYFFSYTILHKNILSFPNWNGLPAINFGNPNFLAGFLVVTLPLLYHFAFIEKNRPILKIFFFITIVTILLTKAVSGILCIGIFVVIESYFNKKRGLLICGLISVLLLLPLFYRNFTARENQQKVFVAESRERIFNKGLRAFAIKPLTGWGWANFDYAFDSSVWPLKIENDVYVDKAHSSFLEVLVTTGVVGFTLYIFIILRVFKNVSRQTKSLRTPLLCTLLLFIVHSQTNIISISEEILFWLIAGISVLPLRGLPEDQNTGT